MSRRGPDDPLWLIADNIKEVGKQLARQGDIMQADVEEEKEPDVKSDGPGVYFRDEVVEKLVRDMGNDLQDVITRAYLNDFERAQAIRSFQQRLAKFEAKKLES